MPNRILREGILTSERIDELDEKTEVFYRRLISVVDDYGRYYAKPELIISAAYPLRSRSMCVADVEQMLCTCVAKKLMKVYQIDGKAYLEITDFRQQIRAKASKFPSPDDANAQHMHSTCVASAHLDVVVVEVGGGDGTPRSVTSLPPQALPPVHVSEKQKPQTTGANKETRGGRIPDDWELTEDLLSWSMNEFPKWSEGQIRMEADSFRDYWKSACGQNAIKRDWSATWRNWLRRAVQSPRNAATAQDSRNRHIHSGIEEWLNGSGQSGTVIEG